jgi:amino acid adenylation domain-containing protein
VLPATHASALVPVEEREIAAAELDAVVAGVVGRPFELSAELQLRATVLAERETGESVLVLVLHHIAMDEWSDRPLLRDLDTAYTERLAGRAPSWPPLPVQYSDYARWHNDSITPREREFWQEALAGVPVELALPADGPRGRGQRAGLVELRLPAALVDPLRELASTESASLFMVLHAALATLLHRHGAGTDLPIGSPTSGRSDDALTDLVGFFVNTVVLRADLSGTPTFAELARRLRETDLAAFDAANLPFQQVVEAVNPPRVPGRNPLFQVMLGYHHRPADSDTLFGLPLGTAPGFVADPKVDLNFTFVDAGREEPLAVSIEYDAGRFTDATAQRLLDRLVVLLADVAARPRTPISSVRMLTVADRAELDQWGNGGSPEDDGRSWGDAFAAQARRTPDADALLFDGVTTSYAELDAASQRFAGMLAGHGVGPDDVVGIALPRSAELVVAVLGAYRAGAAYLPLDPAFPADRLAFMVADARPKVVVVDQSTRHLFPDGLDVHEEAEPRIRQAEPENAAYVLYTSGSTGRPKGVVVTRRDLDAFLAAISEPVPLTPGDRLLAVTTLSFDISVLELLAPLRAGATVVLASSDQVRDPLLLASLIEAQGVTVLQATPSLWSALTNASDVELRDVRALVGGEALPPALARELAARARSVTNLYGPTEVTIWATAADVNPDQLGIGGPLPGTTAQVLDAALEPVPAGVTGELYLGGAQIARGYLGRPSLTASRFVAGPGGRRLYRTGDLARWSPSGRLEFLGRSDDQVKVRGFRIELGEIEAVASAHPDVSRAVVVARGDRLVGYVVGSEVPADLPAFLSAKLPSYMVPATLVALDALPLTPNGKVDRAALPDASEPTQKAVPRSRLEATLCELVAEVLEVDAVGVEDDFFARGGHSLLLVRLATALRNQLGVAVPVAELFTAPTVAAMARRIEGAPGTSALDPVLILREGPNPLFCVHPASGLGWQFAGLKAHLPDDVGLIGLQSPRLSGEDRSAETLGALAAEYADRVVALAPTGSIRLLGWSFGGVLAHQMAVELTARGRRVSFLGLLDARLSVGSPGDLVTLLTELGYQVPDGPMTIEKAVALIRAGDAGVLGVFDDAQIARVVETYLASDRLIAEADFRPYDGDALFVDATVAEPGFTGLASPPWHLLIGTLDVVELTCGHSELLDPATLATLGPLLAAHLAG